MLVSLLIPVLNEEQPIPELSQKLGAVIEANSRESFEIVFVNDGSTDKTVDALKGAALARLYAVQNSLTF